jgi:hypothetical protein
VPQTARVSAVVAFAAVAVVPAARRILSDF